MSKQWQTRPSSFLDFPDSYQAYCFDEAVTIWGSFVESELDKEENENSTMLQRQRLARLNQLLGMKEAPGRFRDPMSMF